MCKYYYSDSDSDKEIKLIKKTVVGPGKDAMDASKAVVENLVDTVSEIVHEGVNQRQDVVFLNKLALLSRQGKHKTTQSMLSFITKFENLMQSWISLLK